MKIRLLGDPGVGKSALIRAASHQPFPESYVPHNDINQTLADAINTTITLPLDDKTIEVLLDAGGKPTGNEKADAVLLVFSLNDPNSFKNLKGYVAETTSHRYPVVFIVGCQSDPKKKSDPVYRKTAEASDRPYWEVNAKTGHDVDLLFQHVATCVSNPNYRRLNKLKFLELMQKAKIATTQKNYEHIIDKLNPEHKEAYQNLTQLAEDIPLINSVTVTMDDKPHYDQRRNFRIALVKTLQKRYHRLLNEWDDIEKINRDIEALKTIERELHIIQPKASQKNTPKAAMNEVKHLIEELTKHMKFVEEKRALNALENNPARAMLFLAKTPNLPNKETLRALVKKHLTTPMLDQPKIQAEISQVMNNLSEEEKIQLKKQLIQATKYEIHDSTNQETEAYQKFYADKDKLNSTIPLIAILCTSGGGKANQKTNSYVTWLARMNESQKKSTKDKSVARTIAEIGLIGTVKRALTAKEEAKKHEKIDEDLFPLSFEGDKPKKT